jgi:hypothetical protein
MNDIDQKWTEPSMEEYIERMFREGNEAITAYLIKNLPEERKPYYREMLKRIREEKENEPST